MQMKGMQLKTQRATRNQAVSTVPRKQCINQPTRGLSLLVHAQADDEDVRHVVFTEAR